MTAPFDAYHQWLGIPPEEQPPNLYRLLGLKTHESDPRVIQNAADRQMAHVRTFQTGPQAALSQKLLNELAAAARCLGAPQSRAAYDLVLKSAAPVEKLELKQQVEAGDVAAAASEAFSPGARVGSYALLERTAASALWVTYKVRHEMYGRLFTLKTLPPAAANNAEVVKRFRREIELARRFSHPNLIVGVDAGEHQGTPYLVFEYVLGADLGTLVRQQGPLPVEHAVDYLCQAARALLQLHLAGVYHRNLKPEVLLVDLQGRLKLSNLLLAKIDQRSGLAPQEQLTRQGALVGSVDYLAPEQARDSSSVDARCDVYSLGCVLHYLLTGQPPYPGKNLVDKLKGHAAGAIPNLRAARADVPERLQQTFARMLAKNPADRFADMTQVLAALQGEAAPVARAIRPARPSGQQWLYIGVAAGVGGALVLALLIALVVALMT